MTPQKNKVKIMKMEYENYWWYKKHKQSIKIVDLTRDSLLKDLLSQLKYPKNNHNKIRTVIDWYEITNYYAYFFDYQGSEDVLGDLLLKSDLNNYEKLILDIDETSVIEVNTAYFIKNWYDFFAASGYLGILVTTIPFKLVMEFTEEGDLYSNFNLSMRGL